MSAVDHASARNFHFAPGPPRPGPSGHPVGLSVRARMARIRFLDSATRGAPGSRATAPSRVTSRRATPTSS